MYFARLKNIQKCTVHFMVVISLERIDEIDITIDKYKKYNQNLLLKMLSGTKLSAEHNITL